MTAGDRFSRIVSLVAELTRNEREGGDALTIRQLGERHGVSDSDINTDIRTLTLLGDNACADWLLSLRIFQQGDHVSISSGGPFRRPVRLSPEEQLAIQVALALDPGGSALATRFAALWAGAGSTAAATGASRSESPADTIRRAIRERKALVIEYAGEGERDVRSRTIQPHQLAESGVRTYVVAWVEDVGAWRHFRLDRIVAMTLRDTHFIPREDFRPLTDPRDVFSSSERGDTVTVRFRPEVAPWVREFFAEHEAQADGSVLVRFSASSKEWLTRRVLEFGADAEVVEPAQYREAVRRAIAWQPQLSW